MSAIDDFLNSWADDGDGDSNNVPDDENHDDDDNATPMTNGRSNNAQSILKRAATKTDEHNDALIDATAADETDETVNGVNNGGHSDVALAVATSAPFVTVAVTPLIPSDADSLTDEERDERELIASLSHRSREVDVASAESTYRPPDEAEKQSNTAALIERYRSATADETVAAGIDDVVSALGAVTVRLHTDATARRRRVESEYRRLQARRHDAVMRLETLRRDIAAVSESRRTSTAAVEEKRAAIAAAEAERDAVSASLSSARSTLKDLQTKARRRAVAASKKKVPLFSFLPNFVSYASQSNEELAIYVEGDAPSRNESGDDDKDRLQGKGISIPGIAVDMIFNCLPVREIEASARTCHAWLSAIEKNRVWYSVLQRITVGHRRQRKEKEDEMAQLNSLQRGDLSGDASLSSEPLTPDDVEEEADFAEDETPSAVAQSKSPSAAASPSQSRGGLFSFGKKLLATPKSAPQSPPSSTKSASASASHDSFLASIDRRAQCPPHTHYALTIEMAAKDTYSVTVESKLVKTVYGCASMQDSIHPKRSDSPASPKRSITIVICQLNTKGMDTELAFSQSVLDLHAMQNVAKADIQRLSLQMESDEQVKADYARNIKRAAALLEAVTSEFDMLKQQNMSDDATKQLLIDNEGELEQQCIEEEDQTLQLEETLEKLRVSKENELANTESEQQRIDHTYNELRQIKSILTKEAKSLKNELEAATAERNRRRATYEEMMRLLQQLKDHDTNTQQQQPQAMT